MRPGSDQRPRGRYNGYRPSQQPQRASPRNQTLDSNGPNIKTRGSAHQIFERYVALAREASIGGDPIAAENFYQHAEHYFRIANAGHEANQQGTPRPTIPADVELNPSDTGSPDDAGNRSRPQLGADDPISSEPSIP